MNAFYQSLIATGKRLAAENGLSWDLPCSSDGKVIKASRWDLTLLCGMAPPPTVWLSDFGYDANCIAALNSLRNERKHALVSKGMMSPDW